jgi:hypothetical protein
MTFTIFVGGNSLPAYYIDNACHFTLGDNDPFVRKAFSGTVTVQSPVFCVSTMLL